MTVLAPLSGSPGSVRLVADRLASTGTRLAAMSGVLARCRDGAVWDGPAGEAFGARIEAVPAVLDAASRRMLGAVVPLRSLALALEDAQGVTEVARREHSDALEWYARLEEHAWSLVSAGVRESDAALLAVRARQREHAATMHRAEARHARAVDGYREADRRCAAALGGLVDEGLADPWGYRGLRAASEAGHAVGYVGALGPTTPVAKGVGLAGEAVGTTADVALLGAYGEGSWSDLGAAAAVAGTAFLGRGLVTGAGQGARLGSEGVQVYRRLSTRERVVAGAAAEARRRMTALRRTFEVPGAPGAGGVRGVPRALVDRPTARAVPQQPLAARLRAGATSAAARIRAGVDARFLDDWRLATANGTRPMYASGVTLQVAAAGGEKAAERRSQAR